MSVAALDPYETLGVPPTASLDFIKWKFRKLAKQYHPDTDPDGPEAANTFRRILAAYAILSDRDQRILYDIGGYQPIGQEGARVDPTTDIGQEAARWERYYESDVQWQVESGEQRRATTALGRLVSETGVFLGDIGLMLITIALVGLLASVLLWGVAVFAEWTGLTWLIGVS
ncbi:MAG: J domain-containing protein [Alphaproteobacteria bacterium]|nr:J domain-containing protein [Alphaproteobacteria bacterium]